MSASLKSIARRLVRALEPLAFGPPVAYVYNPLVYAWRPHATYLDRYGRGKREVLFVGMNPGPWGMAQTGVPFGAIPAVRDWLGIVEPVDEPRELHPKRPIQGFACTREEASGKRLWGWAQSRFGTPERFFERYFVLNYCPLLFLDAQGRNLTPDKLRVAERRALLEPCDAALRSFAVALDVRHVVGVGVFAEQRAREACDGLNVAVSRILHPSPASPAANRGWAEAVESELGARGLLAAGAPPPRPPKRGKRAR